MNWERRSSAPTPALPMVGILTKDHDSHIGIVQSLKRPENTLALRENTAASLIFRPQESREVLKIGLSCLTLQLLPPPVWKIVRKPRVFLFTHVLDLSQPEVFFQRDSVRCSCCR